MSTLISWTIFSFLSLFLLMFFCRPTKAAVGDEVICCSGWSDDDESNLLVYSHIKAKEEDGCTALQFCDGPKCSILYSGTHTSHKTGSGAGLQPGGGDGAPGKTDAPVDGTTGMNAEGGAGHDPGSGLESGGHPAGGTREGAGREKVASENCFSWKPGTDDVKTMCTCSTNYCNCPVTKNQFKPESKPALQCCDGQGALSTKMPCTETKDKPLGCIAHRPAANAEMHYGCGIGDRPFDNCAKFTGDAPFSALEGECRCYTDYCNCLDTNGAAGPPGSGSGNSTGNSTTTPEKGPTEDLGKPDANMTTTSGSKGTVMMSFHVQSQIEQMCFALILICSGFFGRHFSSSMI